LIKVLMAKFPQIHEFASANRTGFDVGVSDLEIRVLEPAVHVGFELLITQMSRGLFSFGFEISPKRRDCPRKIHGFAQALSARSALAQVIINREQFAR